MKNEKLIGTGVALITPFKADGSVDVASLERLVEHQIKNNIDYLVVLGTTAENVTLTKAEKELVKQTITKANAGRLPMVLGIGGNNTTTVIEELKSTNCSDYEAILSVSPYYNKPSQEGIYQHYKSIAAVAPRPILLYNVPGRTGSNIDATTTVRLAKDCPNIIGIKEATGNVVQFMKILRDKPDDFLVISGDDITALATTYLGGDGVISVLAQALAQEFSDMIAIALEGDTSVPNKLQGRMLDLMDFIYREGNPVGIKALLTIQNIIESNATRLPLVPASENLQKILRTAAQKFE